MLGEIASEMSARIANIVEVLNGNGWYYICCPNCARTVRPVEGKYSCTQCPRADIQYTQRVVVRGEDDSGTTTFTLFNKEAEQIIGVPIQTLLSEEGEAIPKILYSRIRPIILILRFWRRRFRGFRTYGILFAGRHVEQLFILLVMDRVSFSCISETKV
nr:PREDICTED: uncharacterized protein LOC108206822 isoform X2 [Daucus carota subsp. sativus]